MDQSIEEFLHNREDYPYGFVTPIESQGVAKGLSEEVIKKISSLRKEPEFILDFRLKAYQYWKSLQEPVWARLNYHPVDYENIVYFSAPKQKKPLGNLEEADPEILNTFKKLGIPLDEQKRLLNVQNVAVDLVFDSVSIGTTFKESLDKAGVIFCSMTEAIHKYPDLIKKYLGSVVSSRDNYFAALNAAVFSDGSFVYVPKGVHCPMEISTYFRINDKEAGQFERTLIIAEEGSFVSYLEGCTAPSYSSNQLHAAVVELVAHERATIRYSTVQNWFSGDKNTGQGGIYNFVTKRGLCAGDKSKISWSQVEVGAAITWKYPSCILKGRESVGEFYSIALTNGRMQADTGTKMMHVGENTTSTIVSKGISADQSQNTFRSLVSISQGARGSCNYTQCDSMLVGKSCGAYTDPKIIVKNPQSSVEHEATTSKLRAEQLLYLRSRGLSAEEAVSLVVHGFCREIIDQLPLEFAREALKLLFVKLENSVG
ncbi:Fe-S cluster assembly protein SufB [Chlamydia gallinacea]|uniref:Fe-S cluster assembly protein SufB n=2 Tax=Chlamydia gallinacea TaxID=1457153 RepID=A0A173DYX1_9CHLA|nr:Fe-S cluster assembly protein SufB [Chlamydia gallinacea]ANG66124.1 Fe-S cluster assembly protein SufB [Chlamydia gallinacea 08-1274/3]EYE60567.1 feS assembly protein SufB [Bacteroides fragilis str. S6L5]MBX6679966.1 Fe-S cluster assembly protein SufB [Chlamydia gallinacea]MBX6687199.1 Fe-S cluster assembly protein SufB [Chlamydia gallinacea]